MTISPAAFSISVTTPDGPDAFPDFMSSKATLFPQSVHSPPFLHRDYPYPKKTPHLTTSQNDTSRFPVSFLHLLQPFHSHPSNTPLHRQQHFSSPSALLS